MRQGQQHRRGRGRNNVNNNNNNHPGNRKGQNPLTRSFESNGPDVKVRGTPAHIAEKYIQLARDAQSSGDHVLAENYLQHAEHYNRIILAYREQQVQQSGEMMNGNGRHHPQQSRQDFMDSDDGGPDGNALGDEAASLDQPPMMRHMGEHPRESQPSFDEPRQHQPRSDQQPRFRDRHPRGERSEHGDRDRFERRERAFRGADQPGESRDMRPQREPREHRSAMQDVHRDIAPPAPPVENGSDEGPPVHDRPHDRPESPAPRRRERFGLGADQPEFLRRPVRRPRREPEQEFAPETPMPPTDEPSRE